VATNEPGARKAHRFRGGDRVFIGGVRKTVLEQKEKGGGKSRGRDLEEKKCRREKEKRAVRLKGRCKEEVELGGGNGIRRRKGSDRCGGPSEEGTDANGKMKWVKKKV